LGIAKAQGFDVSRLVRTPHIGAADGIARSR
jgi:hypothetical protein